MKFFHDFKEYAMQGNVIDMGIGVIVGTAFSKIVDSLVSDIIMPPIGLLLGKVDFSSLYINLSEKEYSSLVEAKEAGAATVNYGIFINTIIHFSIVAFATYVTFHQLNQLRKQPLKSFPTKECPYCFSTIPEKAVRCPNCTSILNKNKINSKEKITKVNINYK